jgi:hypothetical protein
MLNEQQQKIWDRAVSILRSNQKIFEEKRMTSPAGTIDEFLEEAIPVMSPGEADAIDKPLKLSDLKLGDVITYEEYTGQFCIQDDPIWTGWESRCASLQSRIVFDVFCSWYEKHPEKFRNLKLIGSKGIDVLRNGHNEPDVNNFEPLRKKIDRLEELLEEGLANTGLCFNVKRLANHVHITIARRSNNPFISTIDPVFNHIISHEEISGLSSISAFVKNLCLCACAKLKAPYRYEIKNNHGEKS